MNCDLYLASASPRRQELLASLGVAFTTQPADIVEERAAGEPATDYVVRLAREKAEAVCGILNAQNRWHANTAVLGSDTIVTVQLDDQPAGDCHVLEKPRDFAHFQQMMRWLSGRTHAVLTAVHLCSAQGSWSVLVTTNVTFAELSEQDISDYWQTGEPQDKAGGYGIQGAAGKFVQHLAGSYFAVVGLPLYETDQLLKQWQQATTNVE